MNLAQRIEADLKDAMKAKDEVVLSTLRLARTALKNKQIDVQHDLNDEEVVAILRTMVKQYRDALNDFVSAGRQDLAERQIQEIVVLERYLPAAMSETELEQICRDLIQEQAATAKDMGRVMGMVMKKVGGRADGQVVRAMIERLLSA